MRADLSATAQPVTDPERRGDIVQPILRGLNGASGGASLDFPPQEEWVASSPPIEIRFDDFPSSPA